MLKQTAGALSGALEKLAITQFQQQGQPAVIVQGGIL